MFCSSERLNVRAKLLQRIREFFANRHVLEVETPLLYPSTIPSPHIESLRVVQDCQPHTLYLQTSPEFAMKRLLAAGSGDIYQICKAFRAREFGRIHNPEFTILEWYRVDFDHQELMEEVDELLRFVLATEPAEKVSYAELFLQHLQIDPYHASCVELQLCAQHHALELQLQDADTADRDFWLELLLSHLIEPRLGINRPTFVYDFPASQAALARVRRDGEIEAASRFEVYVRGVELANGFHELADPVEQRARFESEILERKKKGFLCPPLDEDLLAALSDLPDCAGVAIGVDRLLMLACGADKIADVLAIQ